MMLHVRPLGLVASLALASGGLVAACGSPPPATTGITPCTQDDDCDDAVFCNGAERCLPRAPDADERGCTGPAVADPCSGRACHETARTCGTVCEDADQDGETAAACGGTDCDDHDAMRGASLAEVCDASDLDEDCNPATFGERDADGDGYLDASCCNRTASGTLACGDDCDDRNPASHTAEAETCDGYDEDCDHAIDEGVGGTFYADADGDGVGDATRTTEACSLPTGYASVSGDCDDHDAARSPSTVEICDGIDNDCDTVIDDGVQQTFYVDADHDGVGDGTAPTVSACTMRTGLAATAGDCDDANPNRSPRQPERCNGIDDDCNGALDGLHEDDDTDGFASLACGGGDCDDTRPAVHPGVTEICNDLDDDCNGTIDDGLRTAYWPDADGDGHGDRAMARTGCTVPAGSALVGGDCDDTNANVHPGAPPLCDGIDDDCDLTTAASDDLDGDGYLTLGATCSGGPFAGEPRTDCNDGDASVHPGNVESCNGRDDDCDGTLDGALATAWCNDGRYPHATATCTSGACAFVCTAPYDDCASSSPGCETDLSSSASACGSCGRACQTGEYCSVSICRPSLVAAYAPEPPPTVLSMANDGTLVVAGTYSGTINFWGYPETSTGGTDVFYASYHPGYLAAGQITANHVGGTGNETLGDAYLVPSPATWMYLTGSYTGSMTFGSTTITSAGGTDGFLLCVSSTGSFRYLRSYGGTGNDSLGQVVADATGRVFVTARFVGQVNFGGTTIGAAGVTNDALVALDNAGTQLWSRRSFATSSPLDFHAIEVAPDGSFWSAASFAGSLSFDAFAASYADTTPNGFLMRFDATGPLQGYVTRALALNDVVPLSTSSIAVLGTDASGTWLAAYAVPSGTQTWLVSEPSATGITREGTSGDLYAFGGSQLWLSGHDPATGASHFRRTFPGGNYSIANDASIWHGQLNGVGEFDSVFGNGVFNLNPRGGTYHGVLFQLQL